MSSKSDDEGPGRRGDGLRGGGVFYHTCTRVINQDCPGISSPVSVLLPSSLSCSVEGRGGRSLSPYLQLHKPGFELCGVMIIKKWNAFPFCSMLHHAVLYIYTCVFFCFFDHIFLEGVGDEFGGALSSSYPSDDAPDRLAGIQQSVK